MIYKIQTLKRPSTLVKQLHLHIMHTLLKNCFTLLIFVVYFIANFLLNSMVITGEFILDE